MSSPPRVGFVLERALGHATHADNLVRHVTLDPRIDAEFAPIEFDINGRWARVPGYTNWTVRAGLRARRAVHGLESARGLDALFVHTQVPATLMPDVIRRLPSVVSLDATPLQYDDLGAHYGHSTGGELIEGLKRRLHRSCFDRADRLVTWSEWAKTGLVDQYDVPPSKVVVIPPGVDCERWSRPPGCVEDHRDAARVRILFVGGDFTRKGGDTLVSAVRRLRADGADVELDIVTSARVPNEVGITVHRGLSANSPALMHLYWSSDIFCLPTLGDMLAIVLPEAGAAGLPLVSTDVGAIRELVRPDETGLLVPPSDEVELAASLSRLVDDPTLRRSLGANAQRVVREEYNAATNASRVVELLVEVARRR